MDDGEASKLWIAGGGTTAVTVTVVDCIAVWPAPSVTVSVYVVETGGVTITDPPLAMAPTPLSMLPVPPLNVAERVALSPAVMLCGEAVKLWIAGGGTTAVTVTGVDCVAVWPAPSVTVSVYVVETGGVTVTDPPLAMTPTPLSMLPVPPLNVAERVALS